ncbi:MAG: Gfo/Idh/MocA family oxidoreductase [Desulfobacterales bacterium]
MSKHILIIGTGSAGKRHARNFQSLGCSISCMDPRRDRLEDLAGEGIKATSVFTNLEDALGSRDGAFDAVVVASPPLFHVDQCLAALERGLPVLLEKPVSPDLANSLKLQQAVRDSEAPLLLGYTWRWWRPLLKVKQLVDQRVVGQLRYVKFTMAAHLADWHPWERYQDFFMASSELGGGAMLDESHWLDLMLWFFGMPQKLFATIDKISDLEIDTDDNVDVMVQYADNLRVNLHLDLYARPHEKSIQFVGEEGTMIWEPNQIRIGKQMEPEWETEEFSVDRNDMFVAAAEEFLAIIGGQADYTCTIDDGVRVLRLIEAARASSREEKVIRLDPAG